MTMPGIKIPVMDELIFVLSLHLLDIKFSLFLSRIKKFILKSLFNKNKNKKKKPKTEFGFKTKKKLFKKKLCCRVKLKIDENIIS